MKEIKENIDLISNKLMFIIVDNNIHQKINIQSIFTTTLLININVYEDSESKNRILSQLGRR